MVKINKKEKHRIVRKLRSKAHQYEWVVDMAKGAKPNEVKVLEHMNKWLLEVADEAEENGQNQSRRRRN